MRRLVPVLLLAVLVVGCGRNSEVTKATKVTNPPESAPSVATVPAPPPMAPPPAIKSVGKDGWVTLQSGLKYKDKKVGTGAEAVTNARVTVQYKGWLDSGKVFDTSRKPGREPFSFLIDGGEVIKGWDEGVKGMKIGGIRELTVPPALGYGPKGNGPIPPKATLHFEVELLNVSS